VPRVTRHEIAGWASRWRFPVGQFALGRSRGGLTLFAANTYVDYFSVLAHRFFHLDHILIHAVLQKTASCDRYARLAMCIRTYILAANDPAVVGLDRAIVDWVFLRDNRKLHLASRKSVPPLALRSLERQLQVREVGQVHVVVIVEIEAVAVRRDGAAAGSGDARNKRSVVE
jgi:hypothetical protein